MKYLRTMSSLTEAEEHFISYWEANRLRQKKLLNQLLIGLPLGILFGLPVLINLFLRWYKRADMEAHTQLNPVVLLTAISLIIVFMAIFSRKHRWDRNEQHYRELVARRENTREPP